MSRRQELLNALRATKFDVLVVGGGIVGAGIARDAARYLVFRPCRAMVGYRETSR